MHLLYSISSDLAALLLANASLLINEQARLQLGQVLQ